MPNSATQLYHKNPDLQVVLDFLGRCVPDGQQVTAHYRDAHELDVVKAACAAWRVHPADIIPAPAMYGRVQASPGLMLDREAWLLLAKEGISLLAQELRRRLPAINAALKLVPVPWDALSLPDSALAAWGTAAGMIALPGRTVFDYFGSRYPSESAQRGRYAIVRDLGHATTYRENGALGFLLAKEGMQNFACHRDDWRNEMTSARSMLDEHLSLMLKIGLHMLEAGATGQLKALHTVLALAGETPSMVRLQTLLETYEDHVTIYGPGQNRFRDKLLKNCLGEFHQWRTNCSTAAREAPGVAYRHSPTASMQEWKWIDSDVAAVVAASAEPAPCALPAMAVASARDAPVVADGVAIPRGVTVARGAHIRVCAISSGTHLKPGTVLHGDVSIASHTRFEGPVTIMNDVRIGWGLTFGSGLILTEGATISAFTVKCRLPRGTRVGGSLRIGANARVDNNVSFGAENWIGNNVHIAENVRLGPCVKVENGISIGANAWIKGHTRLIGNVPENAEVAIPAEDGTSLKKGQASPAYAVGIGGFTITKNETIRERPAMPRQPLAAEFAIDHEASNDLPHAALHDGESPDRHAGNRSLKKPHLFAVRPVVAANDPLPTRPTTPEVGRPRNGPGSMVATPPVRPGAPAGLQRKRAGEPIAGRPAKQARIDLESRYREAESGGSPANVGNSTADRPQEKTLSLPRSMNRSAFMPLQANTTSRAASSSTSWLDQQRPVQRPSAIAPPPAQAVVPFVSHCAGSAVPEGQRTAMSAPGGARQAVRETGSDREAQRLSWQKSVLSKENQNALERSMRRVIQVPVEGPRDQRQMPEPQPTVKTLLPPYDSRGPTL
jgi:acetyltransferase-like isoleucine patch superfamily enzyme